MANEVANDGVMARVLGPVQLVTPHGVIDLPSASQRRLCANLALHAPHPVRSEWLCSVLDITAGALRQSVARLRKVVGDGVLHTSATGYRLDATLDAALAEHELERADGDPQAIVAVLDRWAGPPLAEFADEEWAVGVVARLVELRSSAVEALGEALIDSGRGPDAIGVLEAHIRDQPYRDHPQGLLIRALAAAGRRTEALRSYQSYRAFLAEDAGLEPSDDLCKLEQRIASGWDGIVDDGGTAPTAVQPRWRTPLSIPEPLTLTTAAIGRNREVDLLAAATDRALDANRLGVVVLSGEAGIGKTTLVGEFARRHCLPHGRRVWYGRSDELAVEPLQPFRGLLTRLVEDLPEHVISAHVAARGADLAPVVPALRRHLSAAADVSDEITARHLLFDAAADLLRRAAALDPLVIVLDDLQWTEPTGLQLLRHLVRSLSGSPIAVVACFRDTGEADGDYLRDTFGHLARADAVRIELRGLDRDALGELVRAAAGSWAERGVDAVAELLEAESAGNPLFAEHLIRHWSLVGHLVVDDGSVSVASSATSDVPATLRDLVWHRVGVLDPAGRHVLAAAAVIGMEFDESVLAALAGIDRNDLAELLDRATGAGLLVDDASRPGTMRFCHALVARAMEDDIGSRARARLHERVFNILLGSAEPNERAAQLARHADGAGMPGEALTWAVRAGDRALTDLTPDEAAAWFHRALGYAAALGRGDGERTALLARLGEAEYRAGHPTAVDTLHAAARLALEVGDDETLVRAALAIAPGAIRLGSKGPTQLAIAEAAIERVDENDRTTRTLLLAMLSRSLVGSDQTARRMRAGYDALRLARSSGDAELLVRVAPDLLFGLWAPGTAALRVQIAREAIAIVEESGEPRGASILYHAAHTAAVCAGETDLARECGDRLRALADEVGEPRLRWISALIDGFDALMACRFDEADKLIDECYELGMQIGESEAFAAYAAQFFTINAHRGRHREMTTQVPGTMDTSESVERIFAVAFSIALMDSGHPETGRAILDDAMERGAASIPDDLMKSSLLIGLAIVALGLRDESAAEWLLPELEPMAGEVSFNGAMSQGPVSLWIGRLSAMLGRHADAEPQLRAALAVADRFGWPYHRAAALTTLVDVRVDTVGRLDDEARAWLDRAERDCASGIGEWRSRLVAVRSQLAG